MWLKKTEKIALIGLLVMNVAVAQTEKAPQVNDDARLMAMMDLQYADAQQCYLLTREMTEKEEPARNIIHLLVMAHGSGGGDSASVMVALEAAMARGCPINELDGSGVMPLHLAVLLNDGQMVAYLLEHGADPNGRMIRQNDDMDGLTVQELLNRLLESDVAKNTFPDRSQVQALLAGAQVSGQ